MLAYVVYVLAGNLVLWLDFEFLKYAVNGPSAYLRFCSAVGWFGMMTVFMFPMAVCLPTWVSGQAQEWDDAKQLWRTLGLAVMLVFLCMVTGLGFAALGSMIGLLSEDAAEAFWRFTIPRMR